MFSIPSAVSRILPVLVLFPLLAHSANACTRIFWNTNNTAEVVARTMDLFQSDKAQVMVFPRGIERDGLPGDANSLKWKSKYGSVAVTAFGQATSDGMNEKGLAVNLLYLGTTRYEERSGKPGVSNVLWAQYILDNFKSVKEAVEASKNFQVVSVKIAGREWPLHIAIADKSGDSAVIELIDGKTVIHHGKQYNVMTNEPAYDLQLANLKNYKLFGGNLALPGDVDPLSRFVRAASFLKTLPAPKNENQAVAGVYGVARTVSVPRGAEDTSGSNAEDSWPTLWFTVSDLTHRVYYFQSSQSPNVYWLEFDKLNLTEGSPMKTVDAYDASLSGEIAGRMKIAAAK